MNFLKHGALGFTYKGMLYGFVAWLVFLGVLFGIQTARIFNFEKELSVARAKLVSLDSEKDRQIEMVRLVGKKRMGTSSKYDLATILANRPRWESLLRALTRSLPSDVWLDSVNVEPHADWYKVEMTGKARTQRALTGFILQMEGSGYFSKTALDKTELSDSQTGAFDFKLVSEPVAQRLLKDE